MLLLVIIGYILTVVGAPTLVWVAYGGCWAGWLFTTTVKLISLLK